mgnify:CR=1 FL=1
MKKKFIILTLLVLVIVAATFMVNANQETVHCIQCNLDITPDMWKEWNFTEGSVPGGHYRLTDDFFGQTGTITIAENTTVCLDLNGHTYSTNNMRMFSVAGRFSVADYKGGGMMLSTGENGKYGGFALVQSTGSFDLYGGTIRHTPVNGISPYGGALFYIDGGSVDIHEGGVVTGGTVTATSSYLAMGGNFMVTNSGNLTIDGGTVTQGVALRSSSQQAQGGNIYATKGSRVNIKSGTVEDGYSDTGGGNIFIADAELNVSGGYVQNGHALVSGGNIMANATGANSVTISGGTITGGVCGGTYGSYADGTFTRGSKGGGNIYERSPSGTLSITGGTIDGDIVLDYVKTLTLSGAPKIGLGKSGGMVFTDLGTFKANAKGLTADAEIYVQSSRVFTTTFSDEAAAQTALGCFKGAVRTAISVSNNALQGTQSTEGYCPHCKESVTWKNLNTTDSVSDHCYLSSSLVRSKNLSVGSSLILDLNGYTLHQENTRFIFNYNSADRNLTILDTWAGGKIQGTGTGNANGGLFYIYSNSKFELLSGTLRLTSPILDTTSTDNIVKIGGVIYANNNATVNISGGVITDGSVTVSSGCGGNICMLVEGTATGKLNISGGIIKNGKAEGLTGGNIYSASPVEITGGVILGGKAKNGGSVYAKGSIAISGGMLLNGTATNYGGNLYPAGGAEITGGMIACGQATTSGGNLFVYNSTTSISQDAVIIGGKSSSRAGNIGITTQGILNVTAGLICSGNATTRGGNIDTTTEDAIANIRGGSILLGTSADGGNIYINNGQLNITGGKIAHGKANNGGNIYLKNRVYVAIKDDGDTTTDLPVITQGYATNGDGGNIYLTAEDTSAKYYLHLGNCMIQEGAATNHGSNIYASDKGAFKVLSEFAQSTSIYFDDSRNPVKGGLLLESLCTAESDFAGELRLENITPNPMIRAENGYLRVVAAEIVLEDGNSLWFGSNEDAIKNYPDNAVYMIANAGDLELAGKNYTVDLAGQEIKITGTGNVTCFDSANDDYTNYGSVTIDGPTLVNPLQSIINGKNYVTLSANGSYTFHRIHMGVESINIRPGNAGVYYSCSWKCDSTLAENLVHFGVAVSLKHMPTNIFTSDESVLYTQFTKEDFSSGETKNSVLISNILERNNTENNARGKTAIYGTPYITLVDASGQERAVVALEDNQAQYSLYDVMRLVDDRIVSDPINYRRLTLPLRNFYEAWKDDGMQDWEFKKIPAPADDDVIDVLIISSSFGYYYNEELYGIAEAAGVKIRVCNAYYSGCSLTMHYNFWKRGESNYEFYQVIDNTGRTKTSGMSLEHCLAQGEWDVISIQEGTSPIINNGAQNHLDTTRSMRNELIGYLKAQFPSAKFYWHQPWTYQIGYDRNGTKIETFEQQQERMMAIREFALGVCEENGTSRINTGEAWQIYRKNYVGTNGLTDTLCARLDVGTNHVGDYQHDGDIGGGQYLNACVWFETIMKDLRPEDNITCIGNTYDPVYGGKYKLSQELRTALQESAHQAVIERDCEIPSTEAQ